MSHPRRNDPFAELFGELGERLGGDRWCPDVDVFETDAAVEVRVDIAGVRREDLHVAVDGQVLRVSGVRRSPEGPDAKRLHQMEIAAGPFERRVRIPIAFDRERVTAHLAEGFLTVTLPRRAREPRSVEVRR